jgi:hypothetical protein
MGVITIADVPFGGQPWHHYAAYWGHLPSLLALLALPAMLSAIALLVSAGRVIAARMRRWKHVPEAADSSAGTPVVADRRILASDADREDAVRAVTHSVGEARLSLDEGTERIDQIWQSRHRHELANLLADLPHHSPVPAGVPARNWGRVGVAAAIAASLAAVLVQGLLGLWELWPVAVAIALASAIVRR